jgi:hypothetical protein
VTAQPFVGSQCFLVMVDWHQDAKIHPEASVVRGVDTKKRASISVRTRKVQPLQKFGG